MTNVPFLACFVNGLRVTAICGARGADELRREFEALVAAASETSPRPQLP